MKRETQLVGGNVAANKPCPYKENCWLKESCKREQYMNNEMSCGLARAFDLSHRNEE